MRIRAQRFFNADTGVGAPPAPQMEMLRPEPGQTLTIMTKGADGKIVSQSVGSDGLQPPAPIPSQPAAIQYGSNPDMWQQKSGQPEIPSAGQQAPTPADPAAPPAIQEPPPQDPNAGWRIVRDPSTGQIVTRVRDELVESQMYANLAHVRDLNRQIADLQSRQPQAPPEPPPQKFGANLRDQLLPAAQQAFKGYNDADLNPIVDFVAAAVGSAIEGVRGEYESQFGQLQQQAQQQALIHQFHSEAVEIIQADPRFGTIQPDGSITFDPLVQQLARQFPGESPTQLHARIVQREYINGQRNKGAQPPAAPPAPPVSQIPNPPANMFQTPNGSAHSQSQWESHPEVLQQVDMFKRTQPTHTPEALARVKAFAIQSIQGRQGVSQRQQEGTYAHGIR